MKILVTGSAGFIGSHLVDKYVALGHEVIGVDSRPAGLLNRNARNLQMNLSDLLDRYWDSEPVLKNIDVISHHAAQVDVRDSIEYPAHDAYNNIYLTTKLLEAAVRSGVKKFIYASSAGAVGDIVGQLDPKLEMSPYALSKFSAEQYVNWFSSKHNLDTTILRYSNVYGPRQTKGVISKFVEAIYQDRPLTLNGGSQTRDFVYIDDITDVNAAALQPNFGRTHILASEKPISITELAHKVADLCGRHPQVIEQSLIANEVMHSNLKSTWVCKTDLTTGLRRTLAWYTGAHHID